MNDQITADILIEYEVDEGMIPRLEQAIKHTILHQKQEVPVELSLVLEGDEAVQALNKQYRGYDKTTDILSFESDMPAMPNIPTYLGDMIISVPQATRQSTHFGHPLADEMVLLVVHGTLHLLGYDHATEEEEAEMWAVQKEILEQLGCAVTVPQIMEN